VHVHSDITDVPVDGADAWHVVVGADVLGKQAVADFPRKHGGVLGLVARDGVHDGRGGHLGLGAADHARLDGTSLVVPAEKQHWYRDALT